MTPPLVPPMELCLMKVIRQMVHGGGREGGLLENNYYYHPCHYCYFSLEFKVYGLNMRRTYGSL